MNPVFQDAPGKTVLMMGNEAMARGALEAGVDYSSSYPGSPSSEIQEVLARASHIFGHHAEWAVNEKVALECCVGVSLAGLRSLTAMKQNGLNVAADVTTTVNLAGVKGGVVLVVADDPSGHSSTNETDSRAHARLAEMPLLEPGSSQEAKDMVRFAFELSERHGLIAMVRSVTRISHGRGNVTLAALPARERQPNVGPSDRIISHPIFHPRLHERNSAVQQEFETSPFNRYDGPEDAELLVVASGTGVVYAWEAIRLLGLSDRAGVLKLGTTWPLPEQLVLRHLAQAKQVLVVEEIDPFLEENVKVLAASGVASGALDGLGVPKIFGKRSGHVAGGQGPGIGEIDVDIVMKALSSITGTSGPRRSPAFEKAAQDFNIASLPRREWAFCAGCPHRASFWVMRTALKLDDRAGFVLGDIGCYAMGVGKTGYRLARTLTNMGSGIGFASGLAQLQAMGQPVVALAGDSTFYHACLPTLAHAKYNRAKLLFVVLDNSATSMTGFQPHPGTGKDARGQPVEPLDIPKICRGFGIETQIVDPFELQEAVAVTYDALQANELEVLIFRHKCQLIETRELAEPLPRVSVNPDICLGDACGCMRLCSRVFGCPGLIWDDKAQKALVDDVVCTRCGFCVQVCPQGAIQLEEPRAAVEADGPR